MFNISSYLEKFKSMEPEGDSMKRAVHEAVFKKTGVRVDKKHMSVRNNILHISAPAALKSEIFMKKREILKIPKENVRSANIKDIR